MKTKEEVLTDCKRNYCTTLDVGEHLKEQFESLMESKEYISYYSIKDSVDQTLTWSCFGDFNRNRLWLLLEGLEENKYGFVDSPLAFPVMRDRIAFIDMVDSDATGELANVICLMFEI